MCVYVCFENNYHNYFDIKDVKCPTKKVIDIASASAHSYITCGLTYMA